MNKQIVILFVILLILAITLTLTWLWSRKNKQSLKPSRSVLDTTLELDPPSKVDNIMVEADLPENFDYFIVLLVKKLHETAKEISKRKFKEENIIKQYQNGLIVSALAKFKELNKTLSNDKNAKQFTNALASSTKNTTVGIDFNSIEENDVEQLVDLNENLITVVYPCLIN